MLKPEHIRILKLAGIPHEGVLISFDMNSILRGGHYFQSGRATIHAHKEDADRISIEAEVKGNNIYRTEVIIERSDYRMRSQCSCPVATQCKHAIAAVLEYAQQIAHNDTINQARQINSMEVHRWLIQLESNLANQTAQKTKKTDPQENDKKYDNNHLIYLLGNTTTAQLHQHLTIEPRKARWLKRGGFGQNYRINAEDALLPRDDFTGYKVEEVDRDIIRLISPRNNFSFGHNPLFNLGHTLGTMTLQMTLKSGRAFWKNTDALPLQPAEARQAQLFWDKTEKRHIPKLKAERPFTDFFYLAGQLYYVDIELGHCGSLETDTLSAEQLLQLLQAPAIPELEAKRVSQKLMDILPDADVPLPNPGVRPPTEDIPNTKPTIDLSLNTQYVTDLNQAVHIASLKFDYAGHLLQPEESTKVSIITRKGKRYRIQHDQTTEGEAIQRLMDYGFDIPDSFFTELKLLDMVMATEERQENARQWDYFLNQALPELQAEGWRIHHEDSFNLRFDVVDDWLAEVENNEEDNNAWFELSLGFDIDGQRINLLPLLVEALHQADDPLQLRHQLLEQGHVFVPINDHRWVKLESPRLVTVLDTLIELFDHEPLNDNGNLDFSRYQAAALHALLNDPRLQWKGATELQQLSQKLQDFNGIDTVALPQGLNAELRPYQKQGLDWLQFLRQYQFNGVLADDMGLGKTLQTLAHLLYEKQRLSLEVTRLPNLVIAPTSLMSNWRREAERFTPELKTLVLHGHDRKHHFSSLQDYDIIFTTYPLIVRDEELYEELSFHYLILDEAQAIKNAKSKTTQAVFKLKSKHRLCLTGTPMENHLGELWSMFHFLMPGFLANQERFNRLFRYPIEKHQDSNRQQLLRRRIQAFMLRRTKELVAHELPAKTEIIHTVALEGKQRDLYETVRLAMDQKLRDEIRLKGFARSQIMILEALLKLRQTCCDPRLVKLDKAQKLTQSAKLELLMGMLPDMVEEGRKILLFSQFTSMLALIEEELQQHNIHYSKLTGQTRKREEAINEFQEGDAKVFLISLKAGGTGLNLTAADTVIHYDPWWNPAAEQQATDRAYRIGQDKPVFVYKLITEETVEEKILKLQQRKQALADGLYQDNISQNAQLTQDDLMDLLQPLSDV